MAAGVFAATSEGELWTAVDKLAIDAASAESDHEDALRAEEKPQSAADIAEDIESPFSSEAT
jgi:hypothetical protein